MCWWVWLHLCGPKVGPNPPPDIATSRCYDHIILSIVVGGVVCAECSVTWPVPSSFARRVQLSTNFTSSICCRLVGQEVIDHQSRL